VSVVVDAAAVMALMLAESGAEQVSAVIRGSLMSAVNVSESCARGVERGASAEDVLTILHEYEVRIVAFDLRQALEAARLREPTRSAGAGIGDRACLALGRTHEATIYTGDRRLATVADRTGLDIRLIR
jgi:PIN domain nuclease of toxin-antitoxin system